METSKKPPTGRKGYLAAMVLGTALAAAGNGEAARGAEISGRAIHDISRYCTACWRNARVPVDRWNDCTQEVFRRLLERLDPAAWDQVLASEGDQRKEFLRAIDAVKKRTQRERQRSPLGHDQAVDQRDAHEHRRHDDREALQRAAQELLTPRQQQILQHACEGYSIAEIAAELNMAAERISDEKYKAVQKLRAHFRHHADA